uniref:Uncharacterized protein C20orf24 n=1 Tax=Aceria tosichella TaxID=561515 RepID=A0A6G1SI95_9ACAR
MAKKATNTTNSKSKSAVSSSPGSSKDNKRKTFLSLFDKNAIWDDKDEVLDAVYWIRQILAVIMGFIWGLLGLTGFIAIISFAILNSMAAYAIANRTGYDFDPDESLLSVKEGFMATFASFLVTWIVTYTAVHFD